MNDIQEFQRLDKYARYLPELGRRETWEETVRDRVVPFFRDYKKFNLPESLWDELTQGLLDMDALPSMRVIQMAGPSLERCEVGAFNCAALALDSIGAFAELLYILMQGTGCSFSVERQYIGKLPPVAAQRDNLTETYIVPDTTEGWCDALKLGMLSWYEGLDITFDVSRVRPSGTRLVTKGGFASGPEPLLELLEFTRTIIRGAAGRKLTSVECHRIACKIADIVQVGGVRRAATLSHSDLNDVDMRTLKNGEFWRDMPELGQANNSAVYTGELTPEFDIEWENLRTSGSGERGIVRRDGVIPERRARRKFFVNPCGEILLRNKQFCNLSIAVIRPNDSWMTVLRKVSLATIWGTLQSGLTQYKYLSTGWARNSREECLLGVDIPGADANPLFDDPAFLRELRDEVVSINKQIANLIGVNPSKATTCVKPGGNSGVFLGAGHPVNGWMARYAIRRVRSGTQTPMFAFLRDQGVPYELETGRTAVFDFLVAAPETALVSTEMTALEQLDRWLLFKQNWTEHNPSVTIYVGDDEWGQVKSWLKANWAWVGGLSFFPKSDHVYRLAPIEAISREEYENRLESFPTIDWSLYYQYEASDSTTLGGDFACVGGACAI